MCELSRPIGGIIWPAGGSEEWKSDKMKVNTELLLQLDVTRQNFSGWSRMRKNFMHDSWCTFNETGVAIIHSCLHSNVPQQHEHFQVQWNHAAATFYKSKRSIPVMAAPQWVMTEDETRVRATKVRKHESMTQSREKNSLYTSFLFNTVAFWSH